MPYLPSPYRRFVERFPQLAESYERLASSCHEAGPLAEPVRRLVKLGVAVGAQSEGAVKSHARRALEGGATPDEVRHAVLLSLTTAGFPGMIAALEWIEEILAARSE